MRHALNGSSQLKQRVGRSLESQWYGRKPFIRLGDRPTLELHLWETLSDRQRYLNYLSSLPSIRERVTRKVHTLQELRSKPRQLRDFHCILLRDAYGLSFESPNKLRDHLKKLPKLQEDIPVCSESLDNDIVNRLVEEHSFNRLTDDTVAQLPLNVSALDSLHQRLCPPRKEEECAYDTRELVELAVD